MARSRAGGPRVARYRSEPASDRGTQRGYRWRPCRSSAIFLFVGHTRPLFLMQKPVHGEAGQSESAPASTMSQPRRRVRGAVGLLLLSLVRPKDEAHAVSDLIARTQRSIERPPVRRASALWNSTGS